ncbi:MAG: arginine--tRNA ligase, partial [Clostridiales bacterium]|nr:arginine--tRNA ligase [Clostridiales bacterium]
GDEKDEVLVRANGIPTYLAADIAYHYNKLVVRGFDKAINIWGADHYGHIARMKNAMKLLGVDPDRLHVITVQLVRLMRGNEIARMSKRKGDSVSLGDLIEEIGVDATRYFFNMRLANSHFDFDLDLAVKKNNDNPVYYVQYAHARICSVLEKAKDYINLDIDYNSAIFTDETEIALLKQLSLFPKNIEIISNTLEPSRLTHYASDLASLFHSFYGKCKVIDEDNLERTKYRISLCKATKIVLSKVLWLLGVSSPDKM